MARHSESRSLPHTAGQMFDLVADIESYPRFLPWCSSACIHSRTTMDTCDLVDADLVISFKVHRERFRSRATLHHGKEWISIAYLDGPMSHMDSSWEFAPEASGCNVRFKIDYEFRSRVLRALVSVVFAEAMQRIVRSFENRAYAIYGPPPQNPSTELQDRA